MSITKEGNVGIGTTSPSSLLHINGTAGSLRISSTTGNSEIKLYDTTDSGTILFSQDGFFNIGSTTTAGTWSANLFTINSTNGNVGIGITNPFAKVTIPSGTGYNGMYAIEVAAHASSRRWWLHTDYIAYGDFSISTETSKQQGANPNLSRLYLNPSGNVGIGTTNPAVKLDIAGSMQVSSAIALSLGGYVRTFAEATGTPSGTTTYFDIAVNVPTGCKLLGAQLRVDTALTAGETWSAAYVTGSTTTLAAAGTAVAKNTKVNKMHVDEITSATTKVRITRDAGNFTDATGVIRAIVYYETFTNLGTAA